MGPQSLKRLVHINIPREIIVVCIIDTQVVNSACRHWPRLKQRDPLPYLGNQLNDCLGKNL